MKKHIISGWEMSLRVQNFLNSNSATVGLIVGASVAKTAIDAKITEVLELQKAGSVARNGSAVAKNKVKLELVSIATEGLSILRAFATIGKDDDLEGTLKLVMRKVKRTGGATLITETGTVYDMMEENLVALLPWEINAATQIVFKAKIEQYANLLSKPKQNTNLGKRIGGDVEDRIRFVVQDFKSLDNLVVAQLKKHPEFVKDYLFNRQLVDLPTRKRAAMLKVLNEVTLEPLGNAVLTTPFGAYKSSPKGNLIIPSASEGEWPVKLKRPGCIEEAFTLVLIGGKTCKQTIYLKAA